MFYVEYHYMLECVIVTLINELGKYLIVPPAKLIESVPCTALSSIVAYEIKIEMTILSIFLILIFELKCNESNSKKRR